MDIERIEEFTTLAQCGSYKSAAKMLGISPALLSNHISLLEKKLGAVLLERNSHGIALTEAGKRFYSDARDISLEYSKLVSDIGSISESEYKSIKIGFSGFIIPSKLGPYLDTVIFQYPNINLEIYDDRSHNICESVSKGELDIFFSYADDGLNFEGIEKELVYTVKVLVLVSMHHHLAHKSSLSLSDLEGERFVLYPKGAENAQHDAENNILKRSGISYSVYDGYICPSAHFVMVPVGKGLALCPQVMKSMIPPNSTAIPVVDPIFEISMYMFFRSDNKNPYLKEFIEGFRAFGEKGRAE